MRIPRYTILALAIALLSFPVWQQVFTHPDLPIQVQIAANNVGTVKAYWDNPTANPMAYEEFPVEPVQIPVEDVASNIWRIEVKALAQKEPNAKSAEVWLVDIRTPENQVNWSKVSMGVKKWTLLDNPYGPQGKIAAAQTGQPQFLEAVVKGGNLTITLLRSAWSGKVRVTANEQVREISLYSANSAVEKLSFEFTEAERKRTKSYEIKVVKTPWHRLKFVSESTSDSEGTKVKSIRIGDQTILPNSKGEFVLPFYFWNRVSCAIAATILSFLGLTILLIGIGYIRRRDPQFLLWQWFPHERSPRSIIKLKIANKETLVLPYQSFKYFLASLAVLMSGLFLTEGYLYYQEQSKIIKVRSQSVGFAQSHDNYQLASMSLLGASASQVGTQPVRQLPQLSSLEWQQEDDRINQNNKKKILTSGRLLKPAQGEWIWRSTGFPVSKLAKKPKRILVMGDSFVWGSGYANMNDIWWRQLQRELIRRGYEQVEVIAAGLSGASTHQELEQAQNLIRIYKPNLIIWGYVSNDPDERIVKLFNYSLVQQDPVVQTLNTLELRRIFPRVSAWLAVARSSKVAWAMSGEKNGYDYSQWEQKLFESENFKLYRKTIHKLGVFQSNSGISGFMMTLPNLPIRNSYTYNYSKVIPLFKTAKVPVYNILDDYINYYSNLKLDPIYGWRINPANGHPGPASTYFHAVKAADILEVNYPQILGKRKLPVKLPAIHVNDWVPYNLNPIASSPGVYTFNYPESEDYMLRLPVGRPFVQLNLEFPVALKEIRLSGSGLKTAALDLTTVDPKRKFDDGKVYSFDEKQGTSLVWNLEGQTVAKAVNTIRLSANQNSDKQLTLTLIPAKSNSQP